MEVFKDILNYEGIYQISNLGNVKSLSNNLSRNEKIMSPSVDKKGYKRVILSKNKNCKTFLVHKLVAQAFLNHIMSGYNEVVDHIDDNPSNNNLINLRVVTSRENTTKYQLSKENKKSKYIGVTYDNKRNLFISKIRVKNKRFNLYRGINEQDAKNEYLNALKLYNEFGISKLIEKYTYKKTSKYKGVYKDKFGNYRAQKVINGKNTYLGTFKNEEDAYLKLNSIT